MNGGGDGMTDMTVGGNTSSSLIAKNTSPASEAYVGISPGRYDAKVANAGATTAINGGFTLLPGMTPAMAGVGAGRIVPDVLVSLGPPSKVQQGTGSAKLLATPPGATGAACVRVRPLKVTGILTPAATESNVATPPGFNVTPGGAPFNSPVRVAMFVLSKTLVATSGNTSMN